MTLKKCPICNQFKNRFSGGMCTVCYGQSRVEYNNSVKEERKYYKHKLLQLLCSKDVPECMCCGEKVELFLTVDHIQNDGFLDGRSRSNYKKILLEQNIKDKYQVLCWNCNCGKNINGGVCPHKTEKLHSID